MMTRIRVVLAMVGVLLAAAAVMAAEGEKPKKDKLHPLAQAMLRMERFHEALEQVGLTDEQKEKMKAIHEEFAPKMKELIEKIHGVFTDDQKKALEEARNAAKAAGKKGRAMFEACEAAVKPTDEQKEKLAAAAPEVVALHKEAVKKVMDILTPEQQGKLKEKLHPGGKKKEHKHETTETK
jgi:Spy/CpxP family protein refolding chaperone